MSLIPTLPLLTPCLILIDTFILYCLQLCTYLRNVYKSIDFQVELLKETLHRIVDVFELQGMNIHLS